MQHSEWGDSSVTARERKVLFGHGEFGIVPDQRNPPTALTIYQRYHGRKSMSDQASLQQRIKEIIADVSQLGIDASEVGDEPNVATRLGLQSTQILEITVELENEFGVEFEDTEITEELWNSVGSLADAILAKQGG